MNTLTVLKREDLACLYLSIYKKCSIKTALLHGCLSNTQYMPMGHMRDKTDFYDLVVNNQVYSKLAVDNLQELFGFDEYDIEKIITAYPELFPNVISFNEEFYLLIGYFEDKPKKTPSKREHKKTKIYVMVDHNTGYHKIGVSKNPKKRESTLQSEKPTIELLHEFEGYEIDELNLHTHFADKRIRGEWFNLCCNDLEHIQNYFKTKKSS